MAEQEMIEVAAGKAELGYRSMLLLPVTEGGTLESDDVSSFLVSRLSAADGGFDQPFESFLS